jgi:hypothetical protein
MLAWFPLRALRSNSLVRPFFSEMRKMPLCVMAQEQRTALRKEARKTVDAWPMKIILSLFLVFGFEH